jgi:hypothetical protein
MTVATEPVLPVAIALARAYLLEVLTPIVPDGRVFWGLGGAPKDMPRVIMQPTSAGKAIRYIGQPTGWEGEIAIRVYALTLEEAEALLLLIAAGLPASAAATDANETAWAIGLHSSKPIPGLTGAVAAVAGIAYRVRIGVTT